MIECWEKQGSYLKHKRAKDRVLEPFNARREDLGGAAVIEPVSKQHDCLARKGFGGGTGWVNGCAGCSGGNADCYMEYLLAVWAVNTPQAAPLELQVGRAAASFPRCCVSIFTFAFVIVCRRRAIYSLSHKIHSSHNAVYNYNGGTFIPCWW